ncbi:MAG: hypothetical protein AAF581_01320 [Planctomycetota bacterium]
MSSLARLRQWARQNLPGLGWLRDIRRRGTVVMFHIGRSGSTVVGGLLAQHPQIWWDGEIYDQLYKQLEAADGDLRRIDAYESIPYLKQRARQRGSAFYGFEASVRQIEILGDSARGYIEALETEGRCRHFIVLERRNTLRTIVSFLAAKQNASYHVPQGEKPPRAPVAVDVNRVSTSRRDDWVLPLVEHLQLYQDTFANLHELLQNRNSLHLTYEDDVLEDPRRAYHRTCDFLQLPQHDSTVLLARTNPYPLPQLIANFDEVAATLAGTSFEWMLED